MEPSENPGYIPGLPDDLGIRDLGGWEVADGRHVRRGLLIRGSALVDLDEATRAIVEGFSLRRILDLRSAGEANGSDDLVPDGATYERVCGMYDEYGQEIDFSPAGIARIEAQIRDQGPLFMENLYATMMFSNPALQTFVRILRAGDVPVFFHCTAGKDRTGGVAALTLMILGATDDTIMEEYLLTNAYRAAIINMTADEMPPDMPAELREKWAEANGVSERLLESALHAIDERYGTRQDYLEAEYGLTAAEIASLRDRYLE